MKIVVSGSTGLIGSALTKALLRDHDVVPLVRRRLAPGEHFLAHVARDWETATAAATRAGIRVVNMRNGVVLTTTGGALAKMLPAFRLGLGGPVGSGNQYLSWIALDDIIKAILHLLTKPGLVGPVNLTAPVPVTNREFAKILGKVLGRPAVVTVPAFALRMAFGTEGAAMLQSGQRVLPARLLASGLDRKSTRLNSSH